MIGAESEGIIILPSTDITDLISTRLRDSGEPTARAFKDRVLLTTNIGELVAVSDWLFDFHVFGTTLDVMSPRHCGDRGK